MNEDYAAVLTSFLSESEQLLDDIEARLLDYIDSDDKEEHLNCLFRNVHTLKGSSGLFDYKNVVRIAHSLEAALEGARSTKAIFSSDDIEDLLKASDALKAAFSVDSTKGTVSQQDNAQADEVLQRLESKFSVTTATTNGVAEQVEPEPPTASELDQVSENGNAANGAASPIPSPEPSSENGASVTAANVGQNTNGRSSSDGDLRTLPIAHTIVYIKTSQQLFELGLNILGAVRLLQKKATIHSVYTDATRLADQVNSFNPEHCFFDFWICIAPDLEPAKVMDLFKFYTSDNTVAILPANAKAMEWEAFLSAANLSEELLTSRLKGLGALPKAFSIRSFWEAAGPANQNGRQNGKHSDLTVRVQAIKLDELFTIIGEMVIANSQLNQASSEQDLVSIEESAQTFNRLVHELREKALKVKMVPIGTTLKRYRRVISELSKALGKEINLNLIGGDTELDKMIIERVNDILLHIIRNAADHGLEATNERLSHGKPAAGTITINTYHAAGHIVIEISDDGRGLNFEKIRLKASQLGLLDSGLEYTDEDLANLIFHPGFSTAENKTDISGRGVGMDVVKKNTEDLRGSIEVRSIPGSGTTFQVKLPLSLAILDGFLIRVDHFHFIIPLDAISECTDDNSYRTRHEQSGSYLDIRGELIPYIRLRDWFRMEPIPSGAQESIIIIQTAGNKIGLICDSISGERQVVLKPLGPMFSEYREVIGACVVGSGDIGFILDLTKIGENYRELKKTHKASSIKTVSAGGSK